MPPGKNLAVQLSADGSGVVSCGSGGSEAQGGSQQIYDPSV